MKIENNIQMSIGNLQYQKVESQTEPFKSMLDKAQSDDKDKTQDEKKLMQACKDLESVFVNMMFKNMRATVPSDGFIEKSFGRETFESMLDEEIAKTIGKGQGVGLAQQMYKQLSRNIKTEE
ncbi:rod-binding protein [Anaerosolibacter sp.]|uniref:rod-binding protein n=1 Tax=Anaerosolibacter sp. TaxID=1872527 RepID=UPI0039EE59BA